MRKLVTAQALKRLAVAQALKRLAVAAFVVLSILAARAALNAPLDTAVNSFAVLFGIWWVFGFLGSDKP